MNCIVLDQGNTSLKWGIFVNNSLVESGRILDNNLSLELNLLYSKHSLPFFYSSGIAGKDRLANVAGAFKIFEGSESLVIDFGTCITYSVAQNNALISGVISLGAQSRLRGMHEFTGQLPLILFSERAEPFLNSTEGAMLSSVNFGILSELKGYIDAAMIQFPDIQIVFTGTDAVHFAKQLNCRIFVEMNLTLIGLYAITCANES